MRFMRIFVALTVVCLCVIARADRLILQDGTVLEGHAIKGTQNYWIKLADGSTRTVPNDDVKSFEKSDTSTPASGKPSSGEETTPSASAASGSIAVTRHKADSVENPVSAVAIWQQFIDSKPAAADLAVAKEQMSNWQKMAKEGAVKIRGRWLTGDDLKAFNQKMHDINKEFLELLRNNQELAAVKKLEEAEKLYPNSFQINFLLGYINLLERQPDKAVQYFNTVLKLQPKLAAATCNIGVALVQKHKLPEAAMKFTEAAEEQDSAEIAHNLEMVVDSLPPAQRNNANFQSAISAAGLLSQKYPQAAGMAKGQFVIMPLREARPTESSPPGARESVWTGTGFIINADGLILTNRHVVKDAKTMIVYLDGGVQSSADVVAIDDEQDLALIRLKDKSDLPIVHFSSTDTPAAGADCTVIGFPLAGQLGTNVKVTRGIVTGVQQAELDADTLVDAKVNPGNSGGPILDKHGNLMAIVSMKTLSTTSQDTYGIGISAGHIRKFLTKNHITVTPGADTDPSLSTEDIAAKIKPSTVLIMITK